MPLSRNVQAVWPGSPTREHGPEARATRAHSVLGARLLPALLLLTFAAQCLWFVGTQSFTVDEPTNLWIGVQHWRGHPEVGDDNPPLLRLLCTLPLLGTPAADVAATNFESEQAIDPIAVAWRTRPMNVLLGVLLGLSLWRTARRRFSVGAANFALALFAFSPPLIAHFSIVGTDGIAALMIFLTALQVAAFRRDPSWRQALMTGVVLGLLLLAKLYTLPMYALALLLVALPSPMHWRLRQWPWGKALAIVAISFLLVWSCYLFRGSKLVVGDHQVWLPAADFVQSIVFQLKHGREGHTAYLLGKVSEHGWRYYFPVAVALKWPTMVLVLGVVALLANFPTLSRQTRARQGWGNFTIRRNRLPVDFGTIFSFPISFFALAIFSTVNIGDRYVLAVYPFLLLFVAGLYPHLPNSGRCGAPSPAGEGARRSDDFGSKDSSPGEAPGPTNYKGDYRKIIWVMALALAAALNAADALRYAPDYLSYFTVFIPAQQSWRYLSDSSLDWGQGLIALHEYERQHPGETLHVAYWTNGLGPDRYGVEAAPFGEQERPTGTVIVSPGVLSGQLNDEQEAYRWLLRYPVKAVLGHDLLVYDVPSK